MIRKPALWRILLICVLIATLLPIMIISQYNHSCADDYSYGERVKDTLARTHNPIEIGKAVVSTVISTYKSWQGTYSAIVLFTLQPAVWGEQYYVLSAYLIIAVLLWGVFSFFRAWIGRGYGRNDIADILSCCVSILFLQLLPSPVQGIFWWNGASYYTIWNALMLIQTSRFFRFAQTQRLTFVQCAISALLGFLLTGSNFVTMLLTLEVSVLFLAYCIYTRKCWKQASVILLFTLAGFIISVSAPGNAVRQQGFTSLPPMVAIVKSFLNAYEWAVAWSPLMLLAILAFFLPFAFHLHSTAREHKSRIPLWLKLVILIGLFVSSFTPTIFVGDDVGAERVQNLRFLLWVVICFMSEVLLVEQVVLWMKKNNLAHLLERWHHWFTLKRTLLALCAFAMVVCFAGVRRYQTHKFNCFTSVSAMYSLYRGEAQEYDAIADQRQPILLSDEKDIVLPPYERLPFVLYCDDVTSDPTNWKNDAAARYFGKKSVIATYED